MNHVLFLTYGFAEGGMSKLATSSGVAGDIEFADLYELDSLTLDAYTAVLLSMHLDQRFLATRAGRLEHYVEAGGTIVANGHVAYPYLRGLRPFHPLRGYRVEDLTVTRKIDHPIWSGVAERELTFRRGVAGFYGRGWHEPPAEAIVIHTIGEREYPVDFIYTMGKGKVLLHGGNDLWQYADATDSTVRIVPQLFQWLYTKG